MKKVQSFIKFVFMMLMIIYSVTSCRSISTKTYSLTTPLINAENSIKIVLISDLHSTIYGKDQTVLINKIIGNNPDLIIMSGDIFDSSRQKTGTQLLLSGISGIAPIYFVTGNHEYWGYDIQAIRDEISSYGITILPDEYVIIDIKNNKMVLAGIDDPDKQYFEISEYNQKDIMEKAFRELDDLSCYKILIAHRPEMIESYKKFSFDLILSGHTHGGQIRIGKGLYAPNQGIFPKYDGGLYKHKNLIHIISRGLSVGRPRFPRIFNPPELVVVILESNM